MVRSAASVSFLILLIYGGCTNVAEQEMLYTAGLNVYSATGLEHLGSIDIDPDARCFTIEENRIYAVCTDGFVRSYDTETRELLEEMQVGLPSASGYLDVVYSDFGGSIYLIGSMGTLLEVTIPECTVKDQFSVCASPMEIEVTQGSPGYLWVLDASENSVNQVHLETNGYCGSYTYSENFVVRTIEASSYPDSLLVGTSSAFFKLETPNPGVFRNTWVKDVSADCLSLVSIPGDSNFVTVLQGARSMKQIGELCVYDDSTYASPPPRFYNAVNVTGDPFYTAPGINGEYVYLLTSDIHGGSILRAYRIGEDYGIEAQVEVPGNPFGIAVSEEGEVYVLTYS